MILSVVQIRHLVIILLVSAFALLSQACTEPFEGTVEGFDDVLVVNTVITNELKRQEVLLQRSYRFEEEGPLPEEQARVILSDDEGSEYNFEEDTPGRYFSTIPFAAELNTEYTLSITTQDGKSYGSTAMTLPTEKTSIDSLYAMRTTNDNGIEGLGIFVDTYDPSGNSQYYRYDFLETYKIIAPLWSPYDVVLIIETSQGPEFSVILREREEEVCYGSARPTTINLANTLNLSEDRLTQQNVRFISSDNYILSHRYSILVRQYVQSPVAFAYYEALKDLIQSSDVFSEDQPGFLAGNLFSINDPNERVVGFFEVATVDEKRIFFDYEDFYPGEELPPYVQECTISNESLLDAVKTGNGVFYGFDPNQPIRTTQRPCGDCTVLGSNKVPDFWIE
ncbi:DUF4249 domain-containing protein [Aggregatimonas sangjinii]|uniref:DUF4249 domain-containing protein n=1 Tax=Aggregatimonas sangjinii TaxID=2583587 RepID=A0A5B7SNP8_9FLAO|nr:DUF4249 domain-containing protein [Aggregatimonas sangjinii]QCW98637.1 DUF4249 domain-containing protein [Aggregatimonas sangjinii]